MGLMAQYVDPMVSQAKFEQEITDFQASRLTHRERGWFLLYAVFPIAEVLLVVPSSQPLAAPVVVRFDYSNYDAEPPSVTLAHPLTGEPFAMKDLPIQVMQVIRGDGPMQQLQSLMQAYGPDDVPFLCVPGVKEYHDNPAHTGDPWELYRTQGAGRLARLLDVIFVHGILPIKGFNVILKPQISGFRSDFTS